MEVTLPLLLILLSTASILCHATIKISTYGCDTSEVPNQNGFYSAVSISIVNSKKCPFADGADNPTCFTSPAEVWSLLQQSPKGHRAISLEGKSMYYLQNLTNGEYWQDLLNDHQSPGPWGEKWKEIIYSRFATWFANFSKIGGTVDIVLSDFEMGGKAYWYDMRNYAELIMTDSKWPALQNKLNRVGQQFNASFTNISDMQSWVGFNKPFNDWRPYVWDMVVVDQYVAELLNYSVFNPIQFYFPNVKMSNFAHHYHLDSSTNKNEWFPFRVTSAVSPIGIGSHVGTHQSTSFYGGSPWKNNSKMLVSSNAERVWEQEGTPFNALVQEIKIIQNMMSSSRSHRVSLEGVHPWIAPRNFECQDPGMPKKVGSWMYNSNYWEESIYHIILSSSSTTLLWWRPGSQRPRNIGIPLLLKTISELETVLNLRNTTSKRGNERNDDENCSKMTPIINDNTVIDDWNVPYILSGVQIQPCNNNESSYSVHRFTPRCVYNNSITTEECTHLPSTLTNNTDAIFKVSSGYTFTPVKNGKFFIPYNSTTNDVGYWIIA